MSYLNKNRIIYRRGPINDKPTETYEWGSFYEAGTHECYELFRSKATDASTVELLVLVTPHLVNPVGPGEGPPMPDFPKSFLDSQDFDEKISPSNPDENQPTTVENSEEN